MKKSKIKLITLLFSLLSIAALSTAVPDGHDKKLDGDTLWKQNCTRCHVHPDFKLASILPYSAGQKKAVMMHMRVVANLPGEEADAIIEYLTK